MTRTGNGVRHTFLSFHRQKSKMFPFCFKNRQDEIKVMS